MRNAILALSVILCFAPLGSTAFGQTNPSSATLTDEERLRGVWVCIASTIDGLDRPDVVGRVYAVFTGQELKMHGRAYAYHLDPKSSPRHCDLTVHPGAAPFHVSYTFQTDVLIVALMVCRSSFG